jgi:hypothetical protein
MVDSEDEWVETFPRKAQLDHIDHWFG